MTAQEADAWAEGLRLDSVAGVFFGASNYYGYVARGHSPDYPSFWAPEADISQYPTWPGLAASGMLVAKATSRVGAVSALA